MLVQSVLPAVQSHSLDLLSCWLCHCPFTAKPSILLTLCESEDSVQVLFDQSGFVFMPYLPVCISSLTGQGGWGPEQPVLGVAPLPMAGGDGTGSPLKSLPIQTIL